MNIIHLSKQYYRLVLLSEQWTLVDFIVVLLLGNDADPAILVVVTEIYIHPLYDPSHVAHDLAIVETYEEIPFSPKVGPACLPFNRINDDFVGDTVKVLGTHEFTNYE